MNYRVPEAAAKQPPGSRYELSEASPTSGGAFVFDANMSLPCVVIKLPPESSPTTDEYLAADPF